MRGLVLFLSIMVGAAANSISMGGTIETKFLSTRQRDDEKPENPAEEENPVDAAEDMAAECHSNGCACQGEIEGIYCGNCWYNAGWAVPEMGRGGRPWHVYECKSDRKCCDMGLHAKCNDTMLPPPEYSVMCPGEPGMSADRPFIRLLPPGASEEADWP